MVPASSPAMPERAANRRRQTAMNRRVLLRNRIPPAAWRDVRPGDYRIASRRIGNGRVGCATGCCQVQCRLPPARATVPAAIADGCGMNVRALNMGPRIDRVLMETMLRRSAGRGNRSRRLLAPPTRRLSRRSNEPANRGRHFPAFCRATSRSRYFQACSRFTCFLYPCTHGRTTVFSIR